MGQLVDLERDVILRINTALSRGLECHITSFFDDEPQCKDNPGDFSFFLTGLFWRQSRSLSARFWTLDHKMHGS